MALVVYPELLNDHRFLAVLGDVARSFAVYHGDPMEWSCRAGPFLVKVKSGECELNHLMDRAWFLYIAETYPVVVNEDEANQGAKRARTSG